ncbi:MAG: hypothetical protein RLZZ609_3134 [Cyanobacteriota bacterium]
MDLRRNGQGGDLTPKNANNNQEITPASRPVPSVPLPIRWKSGSDPLADYLVTFECRMALREPAPIASGAGRQAMGERPGIQERVIEEVEALYPQMPKAKARELGQFMLNGLMLQLRSSGPKSLGTRDHRSWCGRLTEGGGEAYKYV